MSLIKIFHSKNYVNEKKKINFSKKYFETFHWAPNFRRYGDWLDPILKVNQPLQHPNNIHLSAHVSKVIKSANYHIRNIGKIRRFLNTDATKSAIVSLVTSHLDYCNGLLYGITDELLCRLLKVQINAAGVVSCSKKYDHITPVLKDLHWLPNRKRIVFKILLLTFKCMQGCAPLRDLARTRPACLLDR